LIPSILADVCEKVTGLTNYTVEFDNSGYNKGRLAKLFFNESVNYISFSDREIRGRNSSFQSFSTALTMYILEENPDKQICFYFLPMITGNFETAYFLFNYRLMKTANVNFLNANEFLTNPIIPFVSPEDIMVHKDILRDSNPANKSTFITRSIDNNIQIFGKTYGASKYETASLCLALSEISDTNIELYEVAEGGLTKLPQNAKDAIESIGVVQIYTTNVQIERDDFEQNDSLRSASYTYNLLTKLGDKKCALCECDIPQIIQGAHIWPVASIKRENQLTQDEKLVYALDGDNGLWLCQNHHKLLDVNILRLFNDGSVKYKTTLNETQTDYVKEITEITELPNNIVNEGFTEYLTKRNQNVPEELYAELTE
jgi:hypothetical protein